MGMDCPAQPTQIHFVFHHTSSRTFIALQDAGDNWADDVGVLWQTGMEVVRRGFIATGSEGGKGRILQAGRSAE